VRRRAAVIDTNVVVAALLTADPGAPTARILDGMVRGSFPFVLSVALLTEYRQVLLRDRSRRRHGLTEDDVDGILTAIAANAIVREPVSSSVSAPDPGDQFPWELLAAMPGAVLVTGDKSLLESAPAGVAVVLPGSFVDES
jgi:putative PIN family toxin of toxin-antitoxin system